jgi:tetratricopeptide (TPR) repeat protein
MKKKILLIITDRRISGPIFSILFQLGYAVKICNVPKTAVATAEAFLPALIICSSRLPVDSPTDIAAELKAHPLLGLAPFLVIGPQSDLDPEAAEAAVDDWIVPPVNQNSVFETVTRWLEDGDHPPVKIASSKPEVKSDKPIDHQKKGSSNWTAGPVNCARVGRALARLMASGADGDLLVKGTRRRLDAKISGGKIVDVNSNYIREDTLGTFLIQEERITRRENERSVDMAKEKGVPQGRMLIEMGILSEQELNVYLTKQKINKLLRLFTGTWEGGLYKFIPRDIPHEDSAMKPTPIQDVLRLGFLDSARVSELFERFVKNDRERTALVLAPNIEPHVKALGLPTSDLKLIAWLDRHSILDAKNQVPTQFDRLLRLASLLIATGSIRFKGEKAIRRDPISKPRRDSDRPSVSVSANTEDASFSNAKAFFEDGKYSEARKFLEKTLARKPDHSEALALFGWVEFQLGGKTDLDTATRCKRILQSAIVHDDQNYRAYLYLGRILKHERNDPAAEKMFEAASEINPADQDVQREMQLLEIKKRKDRDFKTKG